MSLRWMSCLMIAACFCSVGKAAWEPPADGMLTEKQVNAYVGATREILQQLRAAGQAAEAINGPAAMAMFQRADANVKAAIAKAGFSQQEFEWVGERVWEARGHLLIQDVAAKVEKEMNDRLKKSDEDQAALKQRLAAAETAAKAGRKILTPEQRTEIVAAAKAEQQSILDEVKQHVETWKQAAEEAAKAESDVKTEAAALKRMPKKMNDEERQAYLDEHTRARDEALAAAKDGRTREAEAKKLTEQEQDKADLAGWRAENPDVPVTPEEKAETAKQNEAAIAALKAEIQSAADSDKALKEAAAEAKKQISEMRNQPGSKNAAVIKGHVKEFDDLFHVAAPQ